MTIFSMKNTINTKYSCFKFEKLNFHAKIIYFLRACLNLLEKRKDARFDIILCFF